MITYKNNNGDSSNLQVTAFTPVFNINYDLVEKSDRKYFSKDRGLATDRYATDLTIAGDTAYINQLVFELSELRRNSKSLELSNVKENIFCDNIDHSGTLVCEIFDFKKQTSPNFNFSTVSLQLLIDTNTLIFNGNNTLPDSLKCLSDGYDNYTVWNRHINETYNRDLYVVDREADSYFFTGNYMLSKEENKNLMSWYKNVARGNAIIINEGDFGVERMFGGSVIDLEHEVVIKDIDYSYISADLRSVTINIIRNG